MDAFEDSALLEVVRDEIATVLAVPADARHPRLQSLLSMSVSLAIDEKLAILERVSTLYDPAGPRARVACIQ